MNAEYIAHFGDDLMVVNAARVSMGKWKEEFDAQDQRLIRYLATHQHDSPFFHPQAQFRITAPIFVARQWFRHEVGFSRNEMSRRYVDDAPEFFTPDEWRERPGQSVKQGSGNCLEDEEIIDHCDYIIRNLHNGALEAYNDLLEFDVAPEQARMVLPQSMETQWVETGSLMAYARLCRLRLDPHAQKEIRDLALQISDVMAQLFPYSWQELMQCPK